MAGSARTPSTPRTILARPRARLDRRSRSPSSGSWTPTAGSLPLSGHAAPSTPVNCISRGSPWRARGLGDGKGPGLKQVPTVSFTSWRRLSQGGHANAWAPNWSRLPGARGQHLFDQRVDIAIKGFEARQCVLNTGKRAFQLAPVGHEVRSWRVVVELWHCRGNSKHVLSCFLCNEV